MNVKQMIEILRSFSPEASFDLKKLVAMKGSEGYEVSLNVPVLGVVEDKDNNRVVFCVEHHKDLRYFGTPEQSIDAELIQHDDPKIKDQ